MSTTVLLADDDALVRTAVRELLRAQGNIEVVAEAEDGLDAVLLATDLRPDVVVLDVGLPTLDGLQAMRLIRSRCDAIGVVVLSAAVDAELTDRALDLGAAAVVAKDRAFEELGGAVVRAKRHHEAAPATAG